MKTIPAERFSARDRAGLLEFLEHCRAEARNANRRKYASITLAVRHIDPLAVLESIYEHDQLHAYFEQPFAGEAIAGAEAIASCRVAGADRFARARAFAEGIAADSIVTGDLNAPFAGPHFLFAFGFSDAEESDEFPPATIFLPRWQVAHAAGGYSATANIPVDPDAPVEPLADRVLAAHGRFQAFPYTQAEPAPAARVSERVECGGETHFVEAVCRALGRIDAGAYEKIVLARALDLTAELPWEPLRCVNRLRERFPGCWSFSIGNGAGAGFIGATPERLARVRDGRVETEAVAGSAPRGASARTDATRARELLSSEKDLREHRHVVESIIRRLESLGIRAGSERPPELLQLANVQHLRSPLSAAAGPAHHILAILGVLHPTPAVGGTPREPALADISRLEPFARGPYAGVVGWCDARGAGEGLVGIRSALVRGVRARVFSGAGIVRGSDPERERKETEIKFEALMGALLDTGQR